MLKKLNGKITKLLFYTKNNFLSLLFKLSVLTTMLILTYLVCVLRQADTARRSNSIDVYPIENSQKLMLTTPTKIPSNLESAPSTTEAVTTIISNTGDYVGTHPLFPLPKQTTTTIIPDQSTTPCPEGGTTTETSVFTSLRSTIPFKRSLSLDELNMLKTTTESLRKVTTLTLEEQIEEQEDEGEPTTSLMTPTTTELSPVIVTTEYTTIHSPTPSADDVESDNLFMDNFYHPEETSTQLNHIKEPAESIFLNEDNEFETPVPSIQSEGDFHVEQQIPNSDEEIKQSGEAFFEDWDKYSAESKMLSLELPHILQPKNLLNLFTLDHLPSTSNMKAKWWPKSKNAPVSAGTSVKNHKRHTNSVLPTEKSEELNADLNTFNHENQFEGLDSLLNKKLKDSVNFLERLFGNFHQ